jgi:NACalpha-BTF3-like transcription factor
VLQDVSSKLDALEQAKAEIDKARSRMYETALAELKPRLDAVAVSDPQYAKLQPQKEELAKAQADMEAAAQGGDYDRARQLAQDLTAKLDAFEKPAKRSTARSRSSTMRWRRCDPSSTWPRSRHRRRRSRRSGPRSSRARPTLTPPQPLPDYEAALKAVHGLEPNLDAYAEALKTLESKKKEYDTALAELQPRLGKALAVKDDKLKAKQEALATGQKTMESAALVGNYEEALKVSTDLATQLDAFEKEAGDSGGLDVSLGGEVTLKEITLGKAPLGKVAEAAAKVGGSVKFGPAADADTKGVKKDDVELPVLQKAQDVISKGKWEIGGGPKYNAADKQLTLAVNITFSCEWGPVKGEFAPVEISLVGVDPKKGISGPKASVINLALSYKHDSMKVAVKGVTIEFSFAGSFQVEISPDYAAIAEWVLEKAAIETAEGVIAVDGAALAAGAAAIALPAAAAVAIGFGMYQEARNMRATSEAIQTALPARKRAAQAATSYGKVLTGSSGGGDEGTQHAEAQIAQIMKQTNATREQVIEAIKKAQGGSGAIRARELQRLKDQMYAEACRVFDEGHKADFGIIERQGPDWGYRGSFRKTLRILLYADD